MHAFSDGFIRNNKGCTLFMLDGFTYGKHLQQTNGWKWRCTTSTANKKRCNAFVLLGEKGEVVRQRGEHTHKKPQYHRAVNGIYYLCK
ncbi:FLYWCH zinc finger domain-containing protein [Phthorimaea operculella]|nr:FLYWCH zinc finger domain-containing protein [Phthorimaea operculella]